MLHSRGLLWQQRLGVCYMAQHRPEDQLEAVEAELSQVTC